jgi:hypothetical protein
VVFCNADYFQFIYRTPEGDSYYIEYSNIQVLSRDVVVFEGYTDGYGRIKIDIDHGIYSAIIFYKDARRIDNLEINGSSDLKTIEIVDSILDMDNSLE